MTTLSSVGPWLPGRHLANVRALGERAIATLETWKVLAKLQLEQANEDRYPRWNGAFLAA